MTYRNTTGLLTTGTSHYAFRAAFRRLAHARKLNAQHMALHAILMGKPLGLAFSPISNTTKLANGQSPWMNALAAIHSLATRPDASCLLLCGEAVLAKAQDSARACTVADLETQFAARSLRAED
ncbi:hypothetical protein G3A43_06145 [Paraburkholderia aspalathi]|nr:hypothetical protein [Paraburkholderia aspalathi]MBK3779828.1 hypothetical protein [Paraburkholderia aspalathi]